MNSKYVIVTPVKNEEQFIGQTINAVINQTLKPRQWLIVNDGSTDRTGEIIQSFASQYRWIVEVQNKKSASRKIGGQAALMYGLEFVNVNDYEYIVRMDGDVIYEPRFFEAIFQEFEANPKLGIASGVCFVEEKSSLVEEKHPRFHTRGPLKVYRAECFKAIGGLDPEEGWDTIDEVKANMLGWQTRSFPELKVHHLRKTQTASGVLKGYRNVGKVSYYTGYHPIFMLLRAIKNMFARPYFIGGVNMLYAFCQGYYKKLPQVDDKQFINYLRTQQMNKLLGKNTIWR